MQFHVSTTWWKDLGCGSRCGVSNGRRRNAKSQHSKDPSKSEQVPPQRFSKHQALCCESGVDISYSGGRYIIFYYGTIPSGKLT